MDIPYTRNQQMAVHAAQLLTDLINQEGKDVEREMSLRAFFTACGEEPDLVPHGMFSAYTLSREQIRRIGLLSPGGLPQLPSLPAEIHPPLAYPAPGMAVARKRSYGEQYDALQEVDEIKSHPTGSLIKVGYDWYNQEGEQTTEKGTIKRNPGWHLEPVTPQIGVQLERQTLLQELTGHTSAFLGKGTIYHLPLPLLQRIKAQVDSELARAEQVQREGASRERPSEED